MLKNIIKLEFQIAGKIIQLLCDNDTALEHLKVALCEFIKYVGQVEDQIKANQALAKKEEEKKPDITPENQEEKVGS